MIMIWPIPNCHFRVSAFGQNWIMRPISLSLRSSDLLYCPERNGMFNSICLRRGRLGWPDSCAPYPVLIPASRVHLVEPGSLQAPKASLHRTAVLLTSHWDWVSEMISRGHDWTSVGTIWWIQMARQSSGFGESQVRGISGLLLRFVCPNNHGLKKFAIWKPLNMCGVEPTNLISKMLRLPCCVCVWEPRLQGIDDQWVSFNWAYCLKWPPKNWDGLLLNRWTSSSGSEKYWEHTKYKTKYSRMYKWLRFENCYTFLNISPNPKTHISSSGLHRKLVSHQLLLTNSLEITDRLFVMKTCGNNNI